MGTICDLRKRAWEDASPNVKSDLSGRAKQENKDNKRLKTAHDSQLMANPDGKISGLLAALARCDQNPRCADDSCGGLWGLADKNWPVAECILAEASRERAFVATHSANWRKRVGEKVEPGPAGPGHGYKQCNLADIKFCQKLCGCYHKLSSQEKTHLTKWLGFFRNCARAFRDRAKNSHALLILSSPAPASSSSSSHEAPPQQRQTIDAYVLCEVSLKPLDLCLWKCAVRLVEPAPGETQHLLATLDFDVQANGWRRPQLATMHQQAFRMCREGPAGKQMTFVWDYDVESLSTVRVRNLGLLQNASTFEASIQVEKDSDVSTARALVDALKDRPERNRKKQIAATPAQEPRPSQSKPTSANPATQNAKPAPMSMVFDDEDDEDQSLGDNMPNPSEEPADEPVEPEPFVNDGTADLFENWMGVLGSQDPCMSNDGQQDELDDGLSYEDEQGNIYDSVTGELLGSLP